MAPHCTQILPSDKLLSSFTYLNCNHSPRSNSNQLSLERLSESTLISKYSLMEVTEFQLFQTLKDDAVKGLHSICQQIWNSAVATGMEKVSFHSNPKDRKYQRMFKLLHNCTHLTCYQSNAQNPPN